METKVTFVTALVRRTGMLMLAVFLIACSAGLGYVVHLTRQTVAQRPETHQPSLLPLIALALMIAVAGLATLRLALHRSRGVIGSVRADD